MLAELVRDKRFLRPPESSVARNPECRQGTPAFAALARSEAIYKDERFSDHAPIKVGYDVTL